MLAMLHTTVEAHHRSPKLAAQILPPQYNIPQTSEAHASHPSPGSQKPENPRTVSFHPQSHPPPPRKEQASFIGGIDFLELGAGCGALACGG